MKPVANMGREELGAHVCEALKSAGIDAVLSGGSCVSIWTEESYVSMDLDFITSGLESNRQIRTVLESIGFSYSSKNPRYFTHPDCQYFLEFPRGPLAAGNTELSPANAETLNVETGTLKLLSPTDCVKDRLAGFYAWNDEQSWEQAVEVARRQKIKWKDLQKWHDAEGEAEGYEKFRRAVLAG